MCEVSIIIVNWNTKEMLKNCLSSIYENPPKCSFEVIVIDNASSDGSQQMVKTHFPMAILIENEANVGYSRANNIGFKNSRGKYLLFLNSDTVVLRGTFDKALEFMKNNLEAGVLGCKTMNPNGTIQYSAFNFPSPVRVFAYILGLNLIQP